MRVTKIILLTFFLLAGALHFVTPFNVQGQNNTLDTPTNIIATDGAYATKIGISWDTIRNATRYQIFRNTTNDSTTAISLGTTVEGTFFDASAVSGQTYYFWVRAENISTVSNFSAVDTGLRASGTGNQLNPPSAPTENPVTATKAWLGKALFWDEQLSSSRTVACGTCHLGINGGSDPRSIIGATRSLHQGTDGVFGTIDDVVGSPGVPLARADGTYQWSPFFGFKEQVTGRRGMAAINAAYSSSLFWDGRASQIFKDPFTGTVLIASGAALESQVLGPPVNSTEMGHQDRNWHDIATRVASAKPLALSPSIPAALVTWIGGRTYPELFAEAFGTTEITPARIAMAIATYERTLYSDQTPFDVGILNAAETRGRQVFTQGECNHCHTGTLFTDNLFHNTGVRPATEDRGLFDVTSNANDLAKFRTPSLRNVALRAPYFHNGRFATLEDVVEFYNRGGDVNASNIERNNVHVLNLSAQQKSDLVAFLKGALTDPRVAAEKGPFDRPMLYAESMRVPQMVGAGIAGTNNEIPQAVALEPPLLGNPKFTVGIYNALGGAQAVLVIDKNELSAAPTIPAEASFARTTITLTGDGARNGNGSVSLAIPNNPALLGTTLYGRWYVQDSGAANGVAVTPAFQFTVFGNFVSTAPVIANVSAATYLQGTVAPESIIAAFGNNLATGTAVATSLPLPETLAGVTVTIKDIVGQERNAPLFYVSPTQINYEIPSGTAIGESTVMVRQGNAVIAQGLLQIAPVTPGLFSQSSDGNGLAAALIQRVKSDGTQSWEPIAQYDSLQQKFVAVPVDFGAATDQVFLVLFGTGIRNRTQLQNVIATVGGQSADIFYAGKHNTFVAVDQVNLLLPRTLAGRGNVALFLRADGKTSNTVTLVCK